MFQAFPLICFLIPNCMHVMFINDLQLAGILLDTANLRDPHCTSKDKYMSSLLINGAGRYGCNGLYQLCMSHTISLPK